MGHQNLILATKLSFLFFILVFFNSCSTKHQVVKKNKINHQVQRKNSGDHQAIRFREEVNRFHQKVRTKWGQNAKVSGRTLFVKYSNNFKSRASINFETRNIVVETTDEKNPDISLKKAIIATLLTPKDPSKIELYSEKDSFNGEPFLFGEVLDHEKKSIRWAWRADKYADYLIKNKKTKKIITTKDGTKKTAYFVAFKMIGSKKLGDVRITKAVAKKYKPFVMKQAKKYNIEPSLIFAIMESESYFNPYAVSSIPAFGLMQIVPSSAGADVWKYLKKRGSRPSKRYLFNAQNNIEMGATYLHILNTRYLKDIKNPKTREYCIIAAYNTGSGNVFKTFSKNRKQAIRKINALTPEQVFKKLKSSLPYDETRRYMVKVTNAKKRYIKI